MQQRHGIGALPRFAQLLAMTDRAPQRHAAPKRHTSSGPSRHTIDHEDRRGRVITPRIHIPEDKLADFCRRWKITELALFGSVLRDDFRPDSDVDVMVTFALGSRWSGFDLVDMTVELKALIGREVDLVERDAIRNPFRRHHIMENHMVLYAA